MLKLLIKLFIFFILSTQIFAEKIVCPETITCTSYEEGICELPEGFQIYLELLRGYANNAKFSGTINLTLENIWAAPTSFLDKKITGNNYLMICTCRGKGEKLNEYLDYDVFSLPINAYVNNINFASQKKYGFGGFGIECLSKNPDECYGET
jgi:hypothetical protein